MPKRSSSMVCARTMSGMVMIGKSSPHHLPGGRVGRGRPGRAHAAADHIRADDEILLGIERAAGADHGFPPARLAGHRMHIGDMLIAGQRMADQNGVGAIGVEFAIGLVGDLERLKIDAAIERQRLIRAEQRQQRTRMVRLVRPLVGMDRRTWYRLHACHLDTDPLRRFQRPPQKSGHKKTGLNIGSAGITSVPGLFSELFNVAASRPAQMTTEWTKANPG